MVRASTSAYMPIVPGRLFHKAGNFKGSLPILAVCQSLCSVSCRMSCRLFYEAGTLKDCLTFSQVQESFLCGSCMSSSYSIASSSPGKRSFLPKWLGNSLRSFFNAHSPFERLVLPGADVSHCHEKS